jgi:uncharacterized protein
VYPESFVVVGVSHQDWRRLIENPELSPGSNSLFMILRDQHEVTLVLEENDWQRLSFAIRDARLERGLRLLTLDIELPLTVVGYLALVTGILEAAGISVLALSSFSRDHLLIRQDDLPRALLALGEHVAELC